MQMAALGRGTTLIRTAPGWQRLAFAASICTFGAVLVVRLRRWRVAAIAAAVFGPAAAVVTAIALFYFANVLLNPAPAAVCAAATACVVWFIVRRTNPAPVRA
jgi:hypothetical protein